MKFWIVRAIAPDGQRWGGAYSTEDAARAQGLAWKAEGYRDIRFVPGGMAQ